MVAIPNPLALTCRPLSEVRRIGFSCLNFKATVRMLLSGDRLLKSEGRRLESERRWRESEAGKKAIRDKELRDWAVKYCDDELKNNKSEFQGCLVGIIIFTVFSPLIVVLGGILVAGLLTPFTNFEPSDKVHQISTVVMGIVCFILFISLLFSLKLPHNKTKKNILKELSQDKLDEEKKKYLKALYDQVYGKEG